MFGKPINGSFLISKFRWRSRRPVNSISSLCRIGQVASMPARITDAIPRRNSVPAGDAVWFGSRWCSFSRNAQSNGSWKSTSTTLFSHPGFLLSFLFCPFFIPNQFISLAVLVLVAAPQRRILKKELIKKQWNQMQGNNSKVLENRRFQMRGSHWSQQWAISPIDFSTRVGGSCESRSGSLTWTYKNQPTS